MRSIRSSWGIAILAAVPFLSSSPAFATVLQGSFTIVGLEDVQIGETTINWGQQPDDFSTAIGDVFFPTGTGSFASFSATNGTIRDLNYATEPVNMDLLFNNFLVAMAQPGWNFVLTRIQPGGGSAGACDDMVGSVCTPTGSPLTITNNTATTSTIAMTFLGYVTDGSADASSDWIATFTVPANSTAGQILAEMSSAGYYQSSSAGRFDVTATDEEAAVPEPATGALIGLGLLGFGCFAGRRRISG